MSFALLDAYNNSSTTTTTTLTGCLGFHLDVIFVRLLGLVCARGSCCHPYPYHCNYRCCCCCCCCRRSSSYYHYYYHYVSYHSYYYYVSSLSSSFTVLLLLLSRCVYSRNCSCVVPVGRARCNYIYSILLLLITKRFDDVNGNILVESALLSVGTEFCNQSHRILPSFWSILTFRITYSLIASAK